MNITIDAFDSSKSNEVDSLQYLLDQAAAFVEMDIGELLAISPDAPFSLMSSSDIAAHVLDYSHVEAVRKLNKNSGSATHATVCFKDFNRIPTLICVSEQAVEDFL